MSPSVLHAFRRSVEPVSCASVPVHGNPAESWSVSGGYLVALDFCSVIDGLCWIPAMFFIRQVIV